MGVDNGPTGHGCRIVRCDARGQVDEPGVLCRTQRMGADIAYVPLREAAPGERPQLQDDHAARQVL